MLKLKIAAGLVLALNCGLATVERAEACPFCSAAMQTLSQEIASADGAVIAELVRPMPVAATSPGQGVATVDPTTAAAKFRIVEVLRGQEKLAGAKELDVVYFGDDPPQKKFLITGLAAITPDKVDWTTPVPLSDRAVEYVRKLSTVPTTGVDRLAFFQDYLEDEDRLLAQDAYDEFARAPYSEVVALSPRMKRAQLLKWINDPSVGPSGRRLYLTMLGVCGKPEDVGMLETLLKYDYQLMKPGLAAAIGQSGVLGVSLGAGMIDELIHADERRKKESLDALVACYLKLKGADGLELINAKFLGNPTVEFKYLHAAIMALRFHGEETKVLPREKLLESMRLALDHKEFADQVIPDLTRWEDWGVMPRLVKMFKESEADDWIRQPVASYLLVAAEQPGEVGQRAKETVAELEKLDPETMERARSLPSFSFLAQAATPPASAAATNTSGQSPPAANNASAAPAVAADKAEANVQKSPAVKPTKASMPAEESPLPVPSKIKIIGVPILAALVLLAIFAVLLRGTDPRSSEESPAT
jgi:hypothetical protein